MTVIPLVMPAFRDPGWAMQERWKQGTPHTGSCSVNAGAIRVFLYCVVLFLSPMLCARRN